MLLSPVEASIGNASVQAMAMEVRLRTSMKAEKLFAIHSIFKTYEPQDSEKWDAAYEKWKEIIKNA